jgi:competence protein ComEC
MQRAPLVHAALAYAAGIAAGLARLVPDQVGPLLIPLAVAGCLVAFAASAGWRPVRQVGRAGLLLLLVACAGAVHGASTRVAADRSCLRWLPDDRTATVFGVVTAAHSPQLRIQLDSARIGGTTVPCRGETPARIGGARRAAGTTADARSNARSGAHPEVDVGAALAVHGRWWSPPGATDGPLRRPGALLIDSLEVLAGGGRPHIPERLRRGARHRIEVLYGEQAALAASLLLAQRDALDRDVRDRFARAGLSHLLAISGLHVGLICGILLLIGSLLRLGRRWSAVMAAFGTVGYVLMLGAPHSASRAALQLVLLLTATMLQRPTRPEALVAAAAMVLLAVEPGALLSPGFQLSFAGVAGLLALRPPFLRLLGVGLSDEPAGRAGRARRWLADALATSLAATIATGPIVAWHFGQVAPIGIVANLVAIPLLSLSLPALALALLTSGVWPVAGAFLAGPGVLALAALDRVAATAAAVPYASVAVHGSTAMLLTVAAGAGYVTSRRLGRVRLPIRGAAWAAVAVVVLAAAPLRPPGDRVEIHVIDVGQGDAIAVRSPAGRWFLVDAGIGGRGYDAGAQRVVPYLARRGARRIEGLVLTHPHADHTGGAPAVIELLKPRWVGDPGSPAPSAQYLGVLRVAHGAGTPWVGFRQGHSFSMDGVRVEFLYPEGVGVSAADPNDLSVVLRVAYGDFSVLLTGDATTLVEERLVERYGPALAADALKVAHHGSITSTTPPFLAAAAPTHAFISSGRGNRYGHPHPMVMERLAAADIRIFRTDRHGSIVLRADGRGGMEVVTERGGAE